MKGIRYLKEYFATHFAAVFAFYISMAVFVMALIFMNYLRDEYLHYLREKSYETENAVMDSMQQNLNDSFRELITTASEMVTERSLLDLTTEADRAVKAGKDIGSVIWTCIMCWLIPIIFGMFRLSRLWEKRA